MIESLTLENYKAFEAITIDKLSRFTLLGGKNDVGKTSVLTAIYIYTARLQPSMANLAAMRSNNTNWADTYFHGFTASPEKQIRIGVTWAGVPGRLEVQYDPAIQMEALLNSETERTLPEYIRSAGKVPEASLDPVRLANEFGLMSGEQSLRALKMRWFEGTDQKADILMMLPPAKPGLYIKFSIAGVPLPSALLLPFMRELPDAAARSLSELVKDGAAAEIIENVRAIFPHIHDLTPVLAEPGKGTVLADVGLSKPVPISELGDGAKETLNLMLTIPRIRGGVLLCDELGAGVHASILPTFVQSIASVAKKYDCQVIGTTHSYELLSAAHCAFGRKDMSPGYLTYIRLDRDDSGVVTPTLFDHESLGIAIANNWEIR